MTRIIIYFVSVLAVLCSCKGGSTSSSNGGGDSLAFKYAEHIAATIHDGYTVVRLSDPWNSGKVLHTYILVPRDSEMPVGIPEGTVVRTPLQRAIVATSVHCGLVIAMNRKENIAGICELRYINNDYIRQECNAGRIIDCGSGLSPTLEKIIDLQPDAIFLSPFQNSGGYGRVEELNIPIIETADYMETSALGRAEWMKFYGMLFGAEREADSIFSRVERRYHELMVIAKHSDVRRSMTMDKMTGSVWYVPGGHSTIGKLIQDANTVYPWSTNDNSGSLALPFESVFEQSGNADVWAFRYNAPEPITFKSLLSENASYAQFRAFRSGEVYGCNTATTTFYEDTPFHPDTLLRDFIIMSHPDINLGATTYFTRIVK